MKKIVLLAVLLLSVTIMASAQKSTRTTAYNYLRKGKLDLAKENIDKAVEHEKTMNDPKTWFYYGNIYIRVATDTAYKDLDANALTKAFDGYVKCSELDEKDTYRAKIFLDMNIIANNYYSRGLNFYNATEYSNAYGQFIEAMKVHKSIDNVDTLTIYAAAMSAYSGKMMPEAKKGYEELVSMDYDNAGVYSDLSNIYKTEGNLERAKEILQLGINKYPNEAGILFAKINILLEEEKFEEVIVLLEEGIKLAPENHTLYFVQGQSYEHMEKLDEAAASYTKAIEINAEYSDALFNLGALHYNKAVEIYARANELPLDAIEEYDKMAAEANIHFLDAQPYFESALLILGEDLNLINSLKQIYTKTKQNEKLGELNNR